MTTESEVADLKQLVAGQQADLDERDRELLAILAEHAAEIERLEKGREMKELAVGDVVQLASGGPSMTVVARVEGKGDEALALCRCMYFDGSLLPREVMVPELGLRVGSQP